MVFNELFLSPGYWFSKEIQLVWYLNFMPYFDSLESINEFRKPWGKQLEAITVSGTFL